jgi:hypothetical protein
MARSLDSVARLLIVLLYVRDYLIMRSCCLFACVGTSIGKTICSAGTRGTALTRAGRGERTGTSRRTERRRRSEDRLLDFELWPREHQCVLFH